MVAHPLARCAFIFFSLCSAGCGKFIPRIRAITARKREGKPLNSTSSVLPLHSVSSSVLVHVSADGVGASCGDLQECNGPTALVCTTGKQNASPDDILELFNGFKSPEVTRSEELHGSPAHIIDIYNGAAISGGLQVNVVRLQSSCFTKVTNSNTWSISTVPTGPLPRVAHCLRPRHELARAEMPTIAVIPQYSTLCMQLILDVEGVIQQLSERSHTQRLHHQVLRILGCTGFGEIRVE